MFADTRIDVFCVAATDPAVDCQSQEEIPTRLQNDRLTRLARRGLVRPPTFPPSYTHLIVVRQLQIRLLHPQAKPMAVRRLRSIPAHYRLRDRVPSLDLSEEHDACWQHKLGCCVIRFRFHWTHSGHQYARDYAG